MTLESFYHKFDDGLGTPKQKKVLMPDLYWRRLNQFVAFLKDTRGSKTNVDRVISEIVMHHLSLDPEFVKYTSEKNSKNPKPSKV